MATLQSRNRGDVEPFGIPYGRSLSMMTLKSLFIAFLHFKLIQNLSKKFRKASAKSTWLRGCRVSALWNGNSIESRCLGNKKATNSLLRYKLKALSELAAVQQGSIADPPGAGKVKLSDAFLDECLLAQGQGREQDEQENVSRYSHKPLHIIGNSYDVALFRKIRSSSKRL